MPRGDEHARAQLVGLVREHRLDDRVAALAPHRRADVADLAVVPLVAAVAASRRPEVDQHPLPNEGNVGLGHGDLDAQRVDVDQRRDARRRPHVLAGADRAVDDHAGERRADLGVAQRLGGQRLARLGRRHRPLAATRTSCGPCRSRPSRSRPSGTSARCDRNRASPAAPAASTPRRRRPPARPARSPRANRAARARRPSSRPSRARRRSRSPCRRRRPRPAPPPSRPACRTASRDAGPSRRAPRPATPSKARPRRPAPWLPALPGACSQRPRARGKGPSFCNRDSVVRVI